MEHYDTVFSSRYVCVVPFIPFQKSWRENVPGRRIVPGRLKVVNAIVALIVSQQNH